MKLPRWLFTILLRVGRQRFAVCRGLLLERGVTHRQKHRSARPCLRDRIATPNWRCCRNVRYYRPPVYRTPSKRTSARLRTTPVQMSLTPATRSRLSRGHRSRGGSDTRTSCRVGPATGTSRKRSSKYPQAHLLQHFVYRVHQNVRFISGITQSRIGRQSRTNRPNFTAIFSICVPWGVTYFLLEPIHRKSKDPGLTAECWIYVITIKFADKVETQSYEKASSLRNQFEFRSADRRCASYGRRYCDHDC